MSFTDELKNLLKEKNVSEKSISVYITNLKKLNKGDDFANLNFLKKIVGVKEFLEKFKPSTRKSYYGMIVSVLGLYPKLSKLKQEYYTLFKAENDEMKKTVGVKTETQKDNWVEWSDVEKLWNEKHQEILAMTIPPKKKGVVKTLTETEYSKLLNFMVLSLYTLTPPRRNEDYLRMIIAPEGEDKSKNYLDLAGKQFIFKSFKTSRQYPDQKIDIPDNLMTVIKMYLRYYPKQPVVDGSPFLVFYDGSPLDKVNVITRILNKVFGKKIGVSMLRHSYLTDKYADINKEKAKDATEMGHSLNQQTDYVLE
jgi:integrase